MPVLLAAALAAFSFGSNKALKPFQKIFLAHAIEYHFRLRGRLGIAMLGNRKGFGFRLVDFNIFLQGMDQILAQILGNVSLAISRKATTGFLSLSRSTEIGAPLEMQRPLCAASSTRSNRLSTLSMQSSTVTRAIGQHLSITIARN